MVDFLTDTPESDLWPGTLSLLDEATEPFCVLDPDVEQAYSAFATARHAYAASERDTPHGTDARDRVVEAARILGDALQPLGDVRITRCARLLVSGEECELPLDGQGECGSSRHTEHA
ncbi:hypothetical protein [Catenulispora pinisilvae]|uniref:hypothetical protein n=1 Tax=Catenulispora pinisilvae TaxID=2705253 RepID=UPI0018912BFB|nr:hypothetical protein [Catenulispora pinisilvae]